MQNVLPVSVLIPTMNRPQALERTLAGFMKSEGIPKQIVVVDQSERTEVQEKNRQIIDDLSGTQGIYVYQETPSSTIARNTAISYATEEIIVFSDDDVDVYMDTLERVFRLMQDPAISMIAGLDDNMESGDSKLGYLLGTKSFLHRSMGHVTSSVLGRFPQRFDSLTDTMWAMGFFFAVKRQFVESWNIRWDEKLTGYAYAEDLDFSYSYYKMAKSTGLRCVISRDVHVRHLASLEYRTPNRKSTFMYVLNRAYLSNKHHMGFKSELAMRWCNFWMLQFRKKKGDHPEYMREAMLYLRKHRHEIRQGIFPG